MAYPGDDQQTRGYWARQDAKATTATGIYAVLHTRNKGRLTGVETKHVITWDNGAVGPETLHHWYPTEKTTNGPRRSYDPADADTDLRMLGYRRTADWAHVNEGDEPAGILTAPVVYIGHEKSPTVDPVPAARSRRPKKTQPTHSRDTSTEGDTAAADGDDEVVINTLYEHLDATQKSLERAERRAEQLRRERLTLAKALTEEGEAVATVAARLGVSKQYLHKKLTEGKTEQAEQTETMF